MEKVTVNLCKEDDGSYSCYLNEENSVKLNYGLIGEGETAQEAKEEWLRCYDAMKQAFAEDGNRSEFREAEFTFLYDLPSLLSFYAGKFTFAGLARITGVSAAQLSQYASGYRRASLKTTQKIEKSLHNFADELSQIYLV